MDVAGNLDTAAVCAVIGAVGGLLVPQLVARIPEPMTDTTPADADGTPEPESDPKPLYADLAAPPGAGLEVRPVVRGPGGGGRRWPPAGSGRCCSCSTWCRSGSRWRFVDWRTRLLPTKVIAPSYPVVGVLVLVCFAIERHTDDLVRAGLGWLIAGFVFWFLWRFTPGMGYGDVRLSGVLGHRAGLPRLGRADGRHVLRLPRRRRSGGSRCGC